MEKKGLSSLEMILSILASLATVGSIVFAMLWGNAKSATVQIEQEPGKPIEIRIVDLPEIYDNLFKEKEKLKEELDQQNEQTIPVNVPATTLASVEAETDVILANVIYSGKYHTIYPLSESNSFDMGSDTYRTGFTIGADNYSLFGEGNGFALFDLKGKYSKLHVDVGRVNRTDLGIEDAILKVYLNGEYITEYQLSGQQPPKPISIELNYAQDLKLEIEGSKIVYGFANGIFEF